MSLTTLRVSLLALLCALSLSFALVLPARAAASSAGARTQDAKAARDADDFERAKRMLASGDAAGAAVLLKKVASRLKTDADAWQLLGVAQNRAGKNKDARKSFEKSLKLRPSDADTHAGLSYVLLLLGKSRDAEREAREALAVNPQLAEAHYVVAVMRYRQDKFEEALAEAEAALRAKPSLGAAAYLVGDTLMSLYLDESEQQANLFPVPQGASDDERKAVMEKRDPALESTRARMREAATRLERLADAEPSNPEAALWREQIVSLRFYGRVSAEVTGIYRPSEVMARAVILSKPEPGFTEEARRNNVTGTVRLRAVLSADGRVRHIAVVRGLPDGLTEVCVRAARSIRFKPAVVDGHVASQYVTLEYNFNIY